ncbi:Crp/Fnr family transcriptional regulator [Tropicibacter oceani]|uniref:Crp/Fnr family transcriptional regulator n=1 Tax=Tropicibacter oceani TaxID=3058420 RepID=A0ABY8QJJ9_9RHOB|nr:Crp/Fnr family transcriptional regulator [Tropicibacter oceani]WGW04322.1 Crp/Fnr family transcriptional regulator [Tropicibacter oceani]
MSAQLLLKDRPQLVSKQALPLKKADIAKDFQAVLSQYARAFDAGSTLLIEGEACKAVFVQMDGWMHLSKSLEGGQTQIIEFVLPGDVIDASSADGSTASGTLETLTCGRVSVVPRHIWTALLRERVELHRFAQRMDAARQARLVERMLRLGKGSAEMRVAYALIEFLMRLDGGGVRPQSRFRIPLTQQQLGDYLGLSSVHICRTLRRMVRNDVLDVRDHMEVQINDMDALVALSGLDRQAFRKAIVTRQF